MAKTSKIRSAARAACASAWILLSLSAGGCGSAGKSVAAPAAAATAGDLVDDSASPDDSAAPDAAAPSDDLVAQLDALRKRGEFEAFIDATLNAANEVAATPSLELLKTEALLAAGRNQDAEDAALAAARLAFEEADPMAAGQALKLWTTARFRRGESLADHRFEALLAKVPAHDPHAGLLRFWHDAIGDRAPYRFSAGADHGPTEVPSAGAPAGSVAAELSAIEARANGVSLPLVFIDTGAQHTLMTVEAARAAGVTVGPSATHLVGFGGLKAQPGVIGTLELGELVAHDVPVLVGNSAPLTTLSAQMALGTELMHHVRFTIDYPTQRVFAEPAATRQAEPPGPPAWEIPLWTFSQACLARGELAGGGMARVLVDTGDRAGTYVAPRWAQRNLPQFRRSTSNIVFEYKPRDLRLAALALGTHSLDDWPISKMFPGELRRLDLFDILLGRDLLGPYRLTIDMRQRVLRLRGELPVPGVRTGEPSEPSTDHGDAN